MKELICKHSLLWAFPCTLLTLLAKEIFSERKMQGVEWGQILLPAEEGGNSIAKAAEAGGFQLLRLALLYS